MTVEDLDIIDFISLSKDGQEAELTVSDHLDWTDEDHHIAILQAKIYAYLDSISSGEVYEKYEKSIGKSLTIRVVARQAPSDRGQEFVRFIREVVEAEGVGFRYELARADEPPAN